MPDMNNTSFDNDYDYNGAVLYTVIILILYSTVLFCSFILNIDEEDDYYEKNLSVYHNDKQQISLNPNQADILNTLSDQNLRQKYWRIYYGDDGFESRSDKLASDELKRLTKVSQRMKELNDEKTRHTSKQEELDNLHRISTNNCQSISSNPSPSSFLFNFRRTRSTTISTVPSIGSTDHRSYDVLCETPLCKPFNIDLKQKP